MALEITYAEVKFKNECKSSDTFSDSDAAPKVNQVPHSHNRGFPVRLLLSLLVLFLLLAIFFLVAFIIFFQKYSQILEERNAVKELNHTELNCIKNNSVLMKDKAWSCCPKTWKPFGSHCYFISSRSQSWNQSKEHCLRMGAHLLVIHSEEQQKFITKELDLYTAYYVGLWDPEGNGQWRWVDQMPYNKSATFWHPGEPSDGKEQCVILNKRMSRWGCNDVRCNEGQSSICQMKKTYL